MCDVLRRVLLVMVAAIGVIGALAGLAWMRMANCQAVALLAADQLPNASLAAEPGAVLPDGWQRFAPGAELRGPAIDGQGFELDGDGRALQLIGINNYVETPPVAVHAGQSYCFAGAALTDSAQGSATRLRAVFRWLDAQGLLLAEDVSDWQPVVLWQPGLQAWSPIRTAARAPAGAAALRVRLQPASDDRVYLDALHVRRTVDSNQAAGITHHASSNNRQSSVTMLPWPNGAKAALSFSFDWETSMGGLIHTRSALDDDPNKAQDPVERGLRMRQGVTETLALFEPLGIRATYYATGYNFLLGNTARQTFMGDPTFEWARPANGWQTDWSARPWFSPDPHSTLQQAPAWYFGDLVPRLRTAGQDVQSHTFSHLSGTYALPAQWQADFDAWRVEAATRDVPPARALAFPWSSSAGMSDASWQALERAGITSITRTNRRQAQYQLVDRQNWRCQPVRGHETILACPDFYLTTQSAPEALRLIGEVIAKGGMIDLWAHTEEVVKPEQIAAWDEVVRAAAERRDAGELWIAPLAEIAAWQQALAEVNIVVQEGRTNNADGPLHFKVTNASNQDLDGLTLKVPFKISRADNNVKMLPSSFILLPSLPAGQSLEVTAWPA